MIYRVHPPVKILGDYIFHTLFIGTGLPGFWLDQKIVIRPAKPAIREFESIPVKVSNEALALNYGSPGGGALWFDLLPNMGTMARYAGEVRSYGPGKYGAVLEQVVHAMALEGFADEETGDVELGGHYTLLRGPLMPSEILEMELSKFGPASGRSWGWNLNPAEYTYLSEAIGFILTEDSQGFVRLERFVPGEEGRMESGWLELEAYYNEDTSMDGY